MRTEGLFSGRQVEAFVTQEYKQTDMAKCAIFSQGIYSLSGNAYVNAFFL